VRIKRSKRLYIVVLDYGNGVTRTVKVKANSQDAAAARALKFNPHALGVKHNA
jgi:hypothetical protein